MHAMAVDFPEVHGHPNRLPFEGCLTLVDVPSDKSPSGARGHRVILTHAAAEAALPSLLGMAVDFKAGWDGHDARQKCGIITAAHLEGKRLMVAGFLFARDYPEMERDMTAAASTRDSMGMSYELADAHVADMRASIWTLTRATFTAPPSCCAQRQPTPPPAFASRTATGTKAGSKQDNDTTEKAVVISPWLSFRSQAKQSASALSLSRLTPGVIPVPNSVTTPINQGDPCKSKPAKNSTAPPSA